MGKSKKILILLAQRNEAEVLIRTLDAIRVKESFSTYQFDCGTIILTGLGMCNAQMAAAYYGPSHDEVWNVGFAGDLKGSHPLGELFPISQVGKYTSYEVGTVDDRSHTILSTAWPVCSLQLEEEGKTVVTADFPIHHPSHRAKLTPYWDCVDMEGYGIAFACNFLKLKCRMWKIISDFASPEGRSLIRTHQVALSEKIATTLLSLLNNNRASHKTY